MCFVCGIDNPIELDGAPLACTCRSTPTTGGAASLASGPDPSTKAIPAICTADWFPACWTSQLRFQCTLTLCRY